MPLKCQIYVCRPDPTHKKMQTDKVQPPCPAHKNTAFLFVRDDYYCSEVFMKQQSLYYAAGFPQTSFFLHSFCVVP